LNKLSISNLFPNQKEQKFKNEQSLRI